MGSAQTLNNPEIDTTPDGLLLTVSADGAARKEYILLKNGDDVTADLSGVMIHVPTAQKRAQNHSRYTFENGFTLAPDEEVRINVYPSDDPNVRTFGSKLPLLHDEKRCVVNLIQNDTIIKTSDSNQLHEESKAIDKEKENQPTAWAKVLDFYKPFAFLATDGATAEEIATWEAEQKVSLREDVKAIISDHSSFRLPSFYSEFAAETSLVGIAAWKRFDKPGYDVEYLISDFADFEKEGVLPTKELSQYVLIGSAGEYHYVLMHISSGEVFGYVDNCAEIRPLVPHHALICVYNAV